MTDQAQEWLLSCLRGEQEKMKDLSPNQWQQVVRQAVIFQVEPLIYSPLRNMNIPDEITLPLRRAYQRNALHNTRLYTELRQVFEAFRAAEIPVIVLKGAFLAPVVYGKIALRTMSDADLLVKKRDLARAKEEMLALGYNLPKKVSLSEQHLPPFYRQASPEDNRSKRIEIHWTIFAENGPFLLDLDGLWERAHAVEIAEVEVLGLSPEDLLLHLALHGSYQHRLGFGIRPFCDIRLATCHYQEQIDWQEIVQRAFEWRASKVLYLTLLLAQKLLNAPIPSHVLSALKPKKFDPQLLTKAMAQLFAHTSQEPQIERQIARLSGADGQLDKARLFHESLFLPPEVMARLYPVRPGSLRMYLYYLVRLKYLLGQHGYKVWQLLVRREEKIVSAAEREYALLEWLSSPDKV